MRGAAKASFGSPRRSVNPSRGFLPLPSRERRRAAESHSVDCLPPWLTAPRTLSTVADRILLIKLRELGDTLLATPLIRQLRRLHPHARIDVLCQKANRVILENNPHVDATVELPPRASVGDFVRIASHLRHQRYDLIIDAQGLPKTALMARLAGGRTRIGELQRGWRNHLCYTHPYRWHGNEYIARMNLRLLQDSRVDLDDLDLDFPVREAAELEADAFVRDYLRPPVAAIFGICRFGYRAWPAEKTAAIADRLARLGLQPWLVQGPGQEDAAREIASRMRFPAVHAYAMPSFETLRAILERCALFFGNDGGPKHVAVAANIPTVTVYHACQAPLWAPPQTHRHRVVCSRVTADVPKLTRARNGASALAEIPVSEVWSEIAEALRQSPALHPAAGARRMAA